MAVWWSGSIIQILDHHPCWIIVIQSNLSIHGPNGKSSQCFSSSHRLSTCPSWPHWSSADHCCVSLSPSFPVKMLLFLCSCVISTLCIPNVEFQLMNPTSQVALFSICVGSCSLLRNISWKIYQGSNATLSTVRWTLFNQTNLYENIWFFGKDLLSLFSTSFDINYCR